MPPCLTLGLGPDLFKCPHSMRYSSLSTHKVNTFFSAIPKCVTAFVVIIVSFYVLSVLKRISSQVLPSTNLLQPQLMERCQNEKKILKSSIYYYYHKSKCLSVHASIRPFEDNDKKFQWVCHTKSWM